MAFRTILLSMITHCRYLYLSERVLDKNKNSNNKNKIFLTASVAFRMLHSQFAESQTQLSSALSALSFIHR